MLGSLKIVFAVLICLQIASTQDFGGMVQVCQQKHADRLNECLVNAIRRLQPALAAGIPTMNIPRMEPLDLGEVNFSQQEGPVTINAYHTPVLVHGASKFDVKYFDLNVQNRTIHIGITLPSFSVRGKYKIDGKIFDLPVVGEGDFQTLFTGVALQGFGYLKPVGNALLAEKMNLNFTLQTFKTKMDNLFPDNPVLSETVHHFLNNNQELLVEEIRPRVTTMLEELFVDIVNISLKSLNSAQLSTLSNVNSNDSHRKRTLAELGRAPGAAAGRP